MKDFSPLISVTYSVLIGTVLLFVPALFKDTFSKCFSYSFEQWLSLIYLGVFGTVLGFLWFYQGIKRIEAKDNVKIFNDEFLATGKSGFYDPKADNFILEEDVVINQGTSVATGEKFIYNLTTKKGNLVGQKNDRVIVIINDADVKESKSKKK